MPTTSIGSLPSDWLGPLRHTSSVRFPCQGGGDIISPVYRQVFMDIWSFLAQAVEGTGPDAWVRRPHPEACSLRQCPDPWMPVSWPGQHIFTGVAPPQAVIELDVSVAAGSEQSRDVPRIQSLVYTLKLVPLLTVVNQVHCPSHSHIVKGRYERVESRGPRAVVKVGIDGPVRELLSRLFDLRSRHRAAPLAHDVYLFRGPCRIAVVKSCMETPRTYRRRVDPPCNSSGCA